VKLYDRYFLYVYQNLADSLYQYPIILQLPLAWHFCSKANTIKLEKIQERALRFIYEDYNSTYEELLHIAKVPSLQIRRMRTLKLAIFLKSSGRSFHKTAAVYLKEFLP
jgi:hypothetical protein